MFKSDIVSTPDGLGFSVGNFSSEIVLASAIISFPDSPALAKLSSKIPSRLFSF